MARALACAGWCAARVTCRGSLCATSCSPPARGDEGRHLRRRDRRLLAAPERRGRHDHELRHRAAHAPGHVHGGARPPPRRPITGRVEFTVPGEHQPIGYPLTIDLDARLTGVREPSGVALAPGSRVTIGRVPLTLGGALSSRGPHLKVALDAEAVAPGDVAESIPPPLLGPLQQVRLRGTFDYALRFDLDLAEPDSVDFHADVVPHGLALDPAHTTLKLVGLDQPFTATIHLPHDRLVTRELSSANPHFRTLDAIDSKLVHAVVTNEDGGFFRHRGFNSEAG